MRNRLGVATALVLATISAACGAGAQPRERAMARDSAGITIVENTGGIWREDDAWRLSSEPLVDIGVLDGEPEYQLYQVMGSTRLADGRIVVVDGGSQEVRFYDAEGTYLTAVGGKGEGPGEFSFIGWIGRLPDDSIAVWDIMQSRLSILSPDARFVRSVTVDPIEGQTRPMMAGVFEDGSLFAVPGFSFTFTPGTKTTRDTSVYIRLGLDGAVVDTIGHFLDNEQATVAGEGGAFRTTPPFGRSTYKAVHGDAVYVADNEHYEVAVHGVDGVLRRLIRKTHEPLPVTAADLSAARERMLEGESDENFRKMRERIFDEIPLHKTMPAFSNLVVDSEGNIWIQEYRRPGDDEPRWTVFDPSGQMLGTLTLPAQFRVTEIGSDYVLGVWRDEFDVEHVQLYGLEKPEA